MEKTAKSLNYDFSGVDAAKNDEDLYGLRYSDFVVPLVKAVQELSIRNDSLKQNNSSLQSQVNSLNEKLSSLTNKISQIENAMSKCCSNFSSAMRSSASVSSAAVLRSGASLEQNIPNPFNHTTTINYTLPMQYSSAKIIVTDKVGKVLKEINISGSENGSLKLDASVLVSAAYNYSLYVNGSLVDTKQMEHLK